MASWSYAANRIYPACPLPDPDNDCNIPATMILLQTHRSGNPGVMISIEGTLTGDLASSGVTENVRSPGRPLANANFWRAFFPSLVWTLLPGTRAQFGLDQTH
jgi:hypothetical protein